MGATSAHGAVMRVVTNRIGEIIKLFWVRRRGQEDGKDEQRRGHLRELCSYTSRYIVRYALLWGGNCCVGRGP